MNYEEELRHLLKRYFPEVEPAHGEKILLFYREVLKWNRSINLVSRKDPEKTVERLIVDSLFLLRILEENRRILDIGSGAGFPSIPILLCLNVEIVMAESRKKKVAFLNHVVQLLNLKNARVIGETVSDTSIRKLGRFDAFWAKAALPLEALFSMGASCLYPGGKLVLFRPFEGRKERKLLENMAESHGFSPPVSGVYSCPELYLTRTLTVCQKNEDKGGLG